jgi:hypothetical protein
MQVLAALRSNPRLCHPKISSSDRKGPQGPFLSPVYPQKQHFFSGWAICEKVVKAVPVALKPLIYKAKAVELLFKKQFQSSSKSKSSSSAEPLCCVISEEKKK